MSSNYAFHRSEGRSIEIKLNDLFTAKMFLTAIAFISLSNYYV